MDETQLARKAAYERAKHEYDGDDTFANEMAMYAARDAYDSVMAGTGWYSHDDEWVTYEEYLRRTHNLSDQRATHPARKLFGAEHQVYADWLRAWRAGAPAQPALVTEPELLDRAVGFSMSHPGGGSTFGLHGSFMRSNFVVRPIECDLAADVTMELYDRRQTNHLFFVYTHATRMTAELAQRAYAHCVRMLGDESPERPVLVPMNVVYMSHVNGVVDTEVNPVYVYTDMSAFMWWVHEECKRRVLDIQPLMVMWAVRVGDKDEWRARARENNARLSTSLTPYKSRYGTITQ